MQPARLVGNGEHQAAPDSACHGASPRAVEDSATPREEETEGDEEGGGIVVDNTKPNYHRLQRSLRVHCHLRTNGIPLKLVHTLPAESDARTVAVALLYIDLISARVFSVAPA